MRQLEQYVRGSQLPDLKPNRPALLRPSAVPARTASGGLGSARGEAQTPFQPVAQVAGVRQERYLNGAGRVAVDPSQVSYVSYVATTGNVAVLDVFIPAEQLPQGRFFRFTSDVGLAGADSTPFAYPTLPDLDLELAVWETENTSSSSPILPGILREERDVSITFCIGAGTDKQSDSWNVQFGQQIMSTNRSFLFPERTPPSVQSISLANSAVQLSPGANAPYYQQALIAAGALAEGFGYSLLIGVAYQVRQRWLGPAGFVRDNGTKTLLAVSDGQLINHAAFDGVLENPTRSSSLTYRAF